MFPSFSNLCPPDVSAISLTVVAILTIAQGCKTTDSPAGKSCFREHGNKNSITVFIIGIQVQATILDTGNIFFDKNHYALQKIYIQQNKKLTFFKVSF